MANKMALEAKIVKLAAQVKVSTGKLRCKRINALAALKNDLSKLNGSDAFWGVAYNPAGVEVIVCIPGRD